MDVLLTAFARGGPHRLASLPQVLLKLLELFDQGEVKRDRLVEVISKDAAISARIMAVAHASEAAAADAVTLSDSLKFLNYDAIRSLAIGASGNQVVLRYGDRWLGHLKRLWIRSVSAAQLARSLAVLVDYPRPEEAYLAGLLHNMGQLALGAHAPTQYANLLEAERNGNRLLKLESSHFGIDHCQAGAALVRGWKLRSFMADAIEFQAGPAEQLKDAHPLVRLVHIAKGLSSPHQSDREAAVVAAQNLFDIQGLRITGLLLPAEQRIADIARDFDIRMDTVGLEDDLPVARDKAIQLAHRIRNIAILDGVSTPLRNADAETELAEAIQQGMEILVGVNRCAVFLVSANQNFLHGVCRTDKQGLLDQLQISLEPDRSLPALALSGERTLDSTDAEISSRISVVDRQLLGILESQAMLCVPIINGDKRIGVVVLGMDKAEMPYPQEQLILLGQYARRVAVNVEESRRREIAGDQNDAPEQAAGGIPEARVREILHEARNPLTTVKNYLQILSEKSGDAEWAQRDLKIVREEIERVESILRGLTKSSEPLAVASEFADINQIIEDLLHVIGSAKMDPYGIEASVSLDSSLPILQIDRNGIKQVLMNLFNNACEAMTEGGILSVTTVDHINVNGQQFVEVRITDTGSGIPAEIMAKLFERVKSSKGEKHAGLGLFIVKDIVTQMGGTISCRTSRDNGTTFTMLLPRNVPEIGRGEVASVPAS